MKYLQSMSILSISEASSSNKWRMFWSFRFVVFCLEEIGEDVFSLVVEIFLPFSSRRFRLKLYLLDLTFLNPVSHFVS